MQGSTIATKSVAYCSTNVNSTTEWDCYRYGGEGGSRTHEPGFARLPAFEAGSFNRSDTSPKRKFSGGSVSEQSEVAAIFAPQKTSVPLARILQPVRRRALRLDG